MIKMEEMVMKTDREDVNPRPLHLLQLNLILLLLHKENLNLEKLHLKMMLLLRQKLMIRRKPRNRFPYRYLRSLNQKEMILKSVKKLFGMKMKIRQLNRKSLTKMKWHEPDNPASHYFSDGAQIPHDFWTTGMFSTWMENVNK